MMTNPRQKGAVAMLKVLRDDIEADVIKRDGKPFTPQIVSEAFGELAAQVDALAGVLLELLDEEVHRMPEEEGT